MTAWHGACSHSIADLSHRIEDARARRPRIREDSLPRSSVRPLVRPVVRPILVVVLGLALASLLAACGGSSGPATSGGGTAAPAPAPTPASASAAAQAGGAIPAAAIDEARQIFATRCAACHGPGGKGDGAASAGLAPKPRDFTDAAWQASVTDQHVETIVKFGGAAVGRAPTMPGNPDLIAKPDVVSALRAHVRSLGAAPPAP
jgi:mono/diheme cytochrome c family protein